MSLARFDPPGFLDDLDAAEKVAWSEFIDAAFDRAARGNPAELDFDGPRAQFFNPLRVEMDDDATSLDIAWTAFPRNVSIDSIGDVQRWRKAESSRDL